jgi:hypothetical protein
MAGTGKKWLTGCAIGCVVILGVLGLIAGAGFLMVRNTVEGFQQAKETGVQLAELHGDAAEFVPPGPLALPANRLQLFVQVRRDMAAPQRNLENAFSSFPDDLKDRDEGALRTIFKVLGGLGDLLRPMGEYVETRNRLLLEVDMGQGEYLFYYGLVYYTWLGHAPDDSPSLGDSDHDSGDVRIFAGQDGTFSPAQARLRYRCYTQAMMRNLETSLADTTDPALATAAAELAMVRRRFEADPDQIAWSGDLPPAWQAALEPLRTDLESTYSSTANIFEWPRRESDRRRGLNFNLD